MKKQIVLLILILAFSSGCQTMEKAGVVAVTGTTIGLAIGQAPADAMPGLVFGYKRAEVAVVSENQLKDGEGKTDVANVVMELRYASGSQSAPGVYQRLAVGKTAVAGAGAALMFARGADGTISPEGVQAVDDFINSTSDEN